MRKVTDLSENLLKTGYDFRNDLYRQTSRDVIARHSGFTRYALDIFGPDLIGSFALALDPFKQFHNLPRRVSLLSDGAPIVRTRTPITVNRTPRKESWLEYVLSEGYTRIPGAGIFTYYYTGPDYVPGQSSIQDRGEQPQLLGYIRDTTKASRPLGFTGGEFELFIPKIKGPPRSHSFLRTDTLVYKNIGTGQRTRTRSYTRSVLSGPEFRCTNTDVQVMLPIVRARALLKMQEHVYDMLDKVQPLHKTYDLFYQIAELRDLPRTWKGTIEVWRYFEQTVGRQSFQRLMTSAGSWRNPSLIENYRRILGHKTGFNTYDLSDLDRAASQAYLSFKFGWESTVRGFLQFLPSPAQVSREVNFLIDHIGKDQTFRTKKSWTEKEADIPIFSSPQTYRRETLDTALTKTGKRKVELRLTANFTLNFPRLEPPELRRGLFLRRMGVIPSPSDIYNLVPWTWLIDWFTGTGDYVQLLDTISNDKSLVNHSFITYREESEALMMWKGKYTSTVNRDIESVSTQTISEEILQHSGIYLQIYQLRRSVPSLTNVRSYWDSNLGPSQTAILGALFSAKSGSLGRRDAS